jgi:hypothetical protein
VIGLWDRWTGIRPLSMWLRREAGRTAAVLFRRSNSGRRNRCWLRPTEKHNVKNRSARAFPVCRRELVLGTAAAFAFSSRTASAQAPPGGPATASDITFRDNLAVPLPVPADRSLGKGKDRALALGGGGEYFAAWMLGFAYGLRAQGVPYEVPDVIVGRPDRSWVARSRAAILSG